MSDERLETIRDFVNTHDLETGADALRSPTALVAWLVERALLAAPVPATAADGHRAAAMREALRAHLLANDGAVLPDDAVAVLGAQARRSKVGLEFTPSGVELRAAARGVDGGLGGLLAAVAGAMADGSWSRLKACRADTCRWAFIDRSRNGSRHWCAMGVCGNREKVRAYRARAKRRHRAPASKRDP